MNIESNLKKLKTSIKRRKKITLTLMLGFLMTGVIGYADDPTPTVQELQKQIIKLQTTIKQQNERIVQQNEEIKQKNQEIEKRFNSDEVKIGKGANTNSVKGAIAIGENSQVKSKFGGIAIGQNAYVEYIGGRQENIFAFNNNEQAHLMTSLAIGNNTYARTGGIMIGPHNFRGKMGDIDSISTDTKDGRQKLGMGVYATTLGANSFTNGAFASTTGAYSIMTSKYDGKRANVFYALQNFGAVINGSLNSIESYKSNSSFSGIANSIVGVANRTSNSNGSLIFGAGNEITNSIENFEYSKLLSKPNSPNDLVGTLRKAISDTKGAGATLAIGGANKADYTKQVSMIGTRNVVKGTSSKKTELVSVSGDNNLVENSRNNVAGKNFHVTGEGNILQGFNNINNDTRREVTKNNVVALGNDIEINTDDSVYLGKKSTESKAEKTLWNNKDKEEYKKMYKDYAGFNNIGGIVTVGNDTLTRVIQNVAPGLISPTSTDAINGSQLYNYIAKQYITIKDGKGNSKKIRLGDTLTLKGTTIDVTVKDPDNTSTTPAAPQPAPTPQPANDKPAEHTVTYETDTFEYKLRVKKVDKDKKTTITTTTLIEGADGKLYTQKFLDENEYKNNKWVKKGTDTDSENVSENQHKKTDENVVLSTKHGNIITNVADGTEKNDAVNFGQLKDVITKVEKNTTDIQKLNEKMVEVEKKSDLALGGVANAVAMANLVQVNSYSDYRHNLSAAYGYYGGTHAVAVGFSGINDKRNFIYKLSGAVNSKGNLAFGVGAGVMFGDNNSAHSKTSKKVEELERELKEYKDKVNRLEKLLIQ